ncbi:MAG TPA: hypothetical protein ENK18_17855 [Deltaproteobacteria bacterium]|nr:hypothetical protein [Deltaproteobacteria bacterium]
MTRAVLGLVGFVLGLMSANAWEWFIHKHVLHGIGKNRRSWWSFHFHEHHRASRQHQMIDADYARPMFGLHAQGKEALGLLASAVIHLPLWPISPGYVLGVWASILLYYHRHRRSHEDPGWAREHLPWHYDHHMGPDQDCNWCVTFPWFDHLMGTRVPYAGTEREAADERRRLTRQRRAEAAAASAARAG